MMENQKIKESILKLINEKTNTAFVEMIYELLDSKVYTIFHESTLFSLDRNGKLSSNKLMTSNILKRLYLYTDERGKWLVLFVTKEIAMSKETPKDAIVVEIDFNHLCNTYWEKKKDFAGFKVEIEDVGIELPKEAIKDICFIKELKDK